MRTIFYGEKNGSGRRSKYILRKETAPPGKKIAGVQYSPKGPMYVLNSVVKPKSKRACYSDFLQSTNWDLYYTLTPSYELTNIAARNLMISIDQYYSESQISWSTFFIVEPNPYRDGFHIHGVLKMKNQGSLCNIKSIFQNAYRRISQTNCFHSHDSYIVEYTDKRKGLEYICAWISHSNSDYDIIGTDLSDFCLNKSFVSNSVDTFI